MNTEQNAEFCNKMQRNLRRLKGVRAKGREAALKARYQRHTDDDEDMYTTGHSFGSTSAGMDYYYF